MRSVRRQDVKAVKTPTNDSSISYPRNGPKSIETPSTRDPHGEEEQGDKNLGVVGKVRVPTAMPQPQPRPSPSALVIMLGKNVDHRNAPKAGVQGQRNGPDWE